VVRCSVCGKPNEQVDVMCTSTAANICNECVERAVGVIAEQKAKT
jgi:ATP-dependent protease Clp ATPase subunit